MKSLSILLLALACAFSSFTSAQDCDLYLPADVGTKWELTNYSAKGKMQGYTRYELIDKIVSGNDITFKVKTEGFDKKGKEIISQEFEAFCKDGIFEFDLSFFETGAMAETYKEMNAEVEMEMSGFEMPRFSDPVGTKLDDSKLTMTVKMEGLPAMNMEMIYTDRELVKKENLAVAAGNFDCIVVSQTMSMDVSIVKTKISSKDWYCDGVGMVRNETYDQKGKLSGYSELTSFTR